MTSHAGTDLQPPSFSPRRGSLDDLAAFMSERRKRGKPPGDFAQFEEELHQRVMAVERELLAEELARGDIDAEAVEVDGVSYRRAVRSIGHYQTAAGVVQVERTLYRPRGKARKGAQSLSPLDLQVGIVEGRWTPRAAKQAAWVVAHLTPGQGAEMFERLGQMTPSRSSLERLPKGLNAGWEAQRSELESALRKDEHVPEQARVVALSLDGVMAPMRDGGAKAKRAQAADEGKLTRGPAGYREVGCGTLSFYDEERELLRTVRMGRMPESGKATLKSMLKAELGNALAERPDLTLVALADGARDNWSYLQGEVLDLLDEAHRKVAILDFFHACEHLSAAFGAAYGEGTVQARNKFDAYRRILLEDPRGVDKAIGALAHLHKRFPKRAKIESVLKYFRTHRHMMRYAEYEEAGLPIGSGVIEAACKTLVTQRMKNSGMRWSNDGGQAILNLRSWAQSDRFDRAWALIAARYKAEVHTLANVVSLPIAS
ncbi:MAG: hypothetical protein OEZ06_32820 [Myxococcales bacterium]|nr:hypothetical protein [Myxococcales bacterium]